MPYGFGLYDALALADEILDPARGNGPDGSCRAEKRDDHFVEVPPELIPPPFRAAISRGVC